jgi:hypothetical protein
LIIASERKAKPTQETSNLMSMNARDNKLRLRDVLGLASLFGYACVAIAQAPPAAPQSTVPGGGRGVGNNIQLNDTQYPAPAPGGGRGLGPPAPPRLPANAPEPSPDPRNFDGTWYHDDLLDWQIRRDIYGDGTPFNDAGRKVMTRRVKSVFDGTPFLNAAAYCLPPGQTWQADLNMPFQIFQSKDRMDWLFEEFHGFFTISLDPNKVPPAGYMGRSVGRWEGDTLVVETTGFKEPLWLDLNGTPASTKAKLTQRIRKVNTDHWFLEVINTLEDPTYYTRPWSWARSYVWRPDMTLFRDYNCELSTGAKGGVDPSMVPDPET